MKTLYQFQQQGVDFLLSGGSLLAFQPGAGKTVTALEACKRIDAHRVLVVCPAVALGVWRDEVSGLLGHWPECRPVFLRDLVQDPTELYRLCADGKPFMVITGYEYLVINRKAQELVVQSRYDVLICDESHALKTPTSQRTTAIYGPGCTGEGGISSLADRTWLLTGTPVLNHVGELFPHLRALAKERIDEHTYQGFTTRYCEIGIRTVKTKARAGQPGKNINIEAIKGSKRSEIPELAKRLRGFWLKPKLEELNAQLPPWRLVVRTLPPDACDASFLTEVEDSEEATMIRAALSNGSGLEGVEGQVGRIRRLLGLAKVKAAGDWIDDILDQGVAKVLVWAMHPAVLKQICAARPHLNPAIITGETGNIPMKKLGGRTERDLEVERFQTDPACRLFGGQIMAAGTAITITACSREVFVEQAFTPAYNWQAFKRCHRYGQTQPVLGEVLTIAGSIDEAVGHILTRKTSEIALLEGSA